MEVPRHAESSQDYSRSTQAHGGHIPVPRLKISQVPRSQSPQQIAQVPEYSAAQSSLVVNTAGKQLPCQSRIVPVPFEVNAHYNCVVPKLVPRYKEVEYPVYVPEFYEVPVAIPHIDGVPLDGRSESLRAGTALDATCRLQLPSKSVEGKSRTVASAALSAFSGSSGKARTTIYRTAEAGLVTRRVWSGLIVS